MVLIIFCFPLLPTDGKRWGPGWEESQGTVYEPQSKEMKLPMQAEAPLRP